MHLAKQRELIGSAVDGYFLSDMVLETAMMVGIMSADLAGVSDHDPFRLLTSCRAARRRREAWEMTKFAEGVHAGGLVAAVRRVGFRP